MRSSLRMWRKANVVRGIGKITFRIKANSVLVGWASARRQCSESNSAHASNAFAFQCFESRTKFITYWNFCWKMLERSGQSKVTEIILNENRFSM